MSTMHDGRAARMTVRVEVLAWILALAAAAIALPARHYRTRDPDSRLYVEISARASREPCARWIAPVWPPGWYMTGLYREHPAGLFLAPAALARLGYPAGQAAYLLNALYQVLSIVLLQRLAAVLVQGLEARALAWLIQLIPIAFTFRIRANQEQALLWCLLLAVYATERARTRPWWGLLTAVGLVGLLLVKGVLAVFGPVACALWLICRRWSTPQPRADRAAWLGLGLGVAAMGIAAYAYEMLYRTVTGEPFWAFYLGRQLGVAAVSQSAALLVEKAYNLVWYLGRVVWFPFPWSFTLLASLVAARSSAGSRDRAARTGVVFVLGITALYVGLFSLSDRRADRYIFPVYYAVGAAGVIAALRASTRFRALAAWFDRVHPWTPVVFWIVTFTLHLFAGRLGLPTIKVWAPDS